MGAFRSQLIGAVHRLATSDIHYFNYSRSRLEVDKLVEPDLLPILQYLLDSKLLRNIRELDDTLALLVPLNLRLLGMLFSICLDFII